MNRVKNTTIRFKLAMNMIIVVFIIGVGAIVIGMYIINNNIIREAYDTVNSNLNAAEYIYTEKIKNKHRILKYISETEDIITAVRDKRRVYLHKKLAEIKKEFDFDILNITDRYGKIIIRARNFSSFGDDVSHDKYIRWIQRNNKSCYGTDIMSQKILLKEGKELVERVNIPVIATPRARKRNKKIETRAMVLKTASPIYHNKELIGILYGAIVINKNYKLVDAFKNLIFKNQKVNEDDIGTTTIFLDDLRIATNVLRDDGKRAIGTQVSEEVFKAVFELGKTWLDKAFVVNKWYLAGYKPIQDIDNNIIGILFVGILENKYNAILRNTTIYFLLLILFTTIFAVLLTIILINNVSKPIKNLIETSLKIAEGDYSQIEIKQNYAYDLKYLCVTFNTMVDAINERDRKIKEHTEKKIFQSEKLASLGRLASGIAHEINNPLTGILTYSCLLYDDFKETEFAEDLLVIKNETLRCREIVREILDFARETVLEKKKIHINKIIKETMMILEKHVNFQNIKIIKKLHPALPAIYVDINQLKSVVNNLALNAADAMSDNGTLTIETSLSGNAKNIVIKISDTGQGIDERNLSKIFDPFFTTKETGKGTGLGLAVTYGIIERHNGTIDVKSVPGEGTEFTIELPVANNPNGFDGGYL